MLVITILLLSHFSLNLIIFSLLNYFSFLFKSLGAKFCYIKIFLFKLNFKFLIFNFVLLPF